MGTHWVAWYVNAENGPYFGSYGVEYIPKEINKIIGNKSIQACNSIMCGNLCIDFVLKSKRLLDSTIFFHLAAMKRMIN